MRTSLRTSVAVALTAGIVLGAWGYASRKQLARQLACYRVGAAESFELAQAEIAWFESSPDRKVRLEELVRKWGTGNRQFDLYLARHLGNAACTDSLRESFCAEMDRREELPARWAHYWTYRTPLEPDQQIVSILKYLDTLSTADGSKTITWREVLDLRAVFQLTGHRPARGISPTNWREYYRVWQETRPAELPHVARP